MRKLNTIRRDIAEVLDELESLRGFALTRDEAARRIERWVDQMAVEVHGDHFLRQLAAHGSFTIPDANPPRDHPLAWSCWIDPDGTKKALIRELDKVAAEACATLPGDERKARITELDEKLARLESEEESAIEAAEADGSIIPRRHDADPAIILGAKDPQAGSKQARKAT